MIEPHFFSKMILAANNEPQNEVQLQGLEMCQTKKSRYWNIWSLEQTHNVMTMADWNQFETI